MLPSSELISCIAAKFYLASSLGKRYSSFYIGLDRPLGTQEVEAPRISRQSAYEDGKIVSRTHRPPLPPRRNPWCSDFSACRAMPQPTPPPSYLVTDCNEPDLHKHLTLIMFRISRPFLLFVSWSTIEWANSRIRVRSVYHIASCET